MPAPIVVFTRQQQNNQGMKTALDPRHLKRIKTIKKLFSWSFQQKFAKPKSNEEIIKNLDRIDAAIVKAAPEWPIEQINRILSLIHI